MTPSQIAASLTPAQVRALRMFSEHQPCSAGIINVRSKTEIILKRHSLLMPTGRRSFGGWVQNVAPLGLAVLAEIEGRKG